MHATRSAAHRRLAVAAVAVTTGAALTGLVSAAPAARAAGPATGAAPGCCGAPAVWAAGNKSFAGRAAAPASTAADAWFTGADGILTELFYPNLDTADFTDQQFVVGDAAHTWDQTEKADASHAVSQVSGNALAWTVTNTGSNGAWRITKTIYTDPNRATVVEHVTFTALTGTLGNYVLYQLSNPTQEDNGNADTGQTVTFNSRPMLVASGPNRGGWASNASAVAVGNGLAWASPGGVPMLSSGYVGTNDGWQDLLGGTAPDHTMSYAYSSAAAGNIAQLGQLDLAPVAAQTSVSFDLAIGLGGTAAAAEGNADATLSSLASAPSGLQTSYVNQWSSWLAGLSTYGGTGGQQYLTALMAIKAAQDPATGAIVAGIGTPWGDAHQTDDYGYHRVWSRDLFNSATALLIAGDNADADATARFLFDHQQQADGHFPQNSFVDGSPSWTGIQLDETAYPIVLAWQLRSYDPALAGSAYYASHIVPAADYLVSHGLNTPMERWEENGGYSPSTSAAEIAGLYLASKIAALNGDTARASSYASTADGWRNSLGGMYTTNGPYGNHAYFVRIAPTGNANDGSTVTVANGGGTYNQNALVDGGFLQLAILGILPANDLRVANTAAVLANPNATQAAGSLEQIVPGGVEFFRYNHDGYGETSSGGAFTGAGVGRLWPILDAEYGQYRFLLGESPAAYAADLRHYATPSYQIPEQVWDLAPPAGSSAGTPTRSMSPLNWSMAMYVQLVAAQYNKSQGNAALPGQPVDVYNHYAAATAVPVSSSPSPAVAGQPVTVIYKGSLAASATSVTLHWGHDGWVGVTDTAMTKQANGSWTASVRVPAGTGLNTAFVNQAGTWDSNGGANYDIGAVNAPVSSSPTTLTGGASATIRYAGSLAPAATGMTLHWGRDGWVGVTDTAMTKQSDGSWTATVTVPAGSRLDLAVKNQAGTWDNNGGRNYALAIR